MFEDILEWLKSTDNARYGKASRIWLRNEVRRIDNFNYHVGASDGGFYVVTLQEAIGGSVKTSEIECECPDYKQRGKLCKHIMATMMYIDDQDIDLRPPKEVFAEAHGVELPKATLDTDVHELVVKIPRGTEKLRIVIEVE